nr:retrovirus-related Pol polyprotein from transposon TNT 1-94 [Tanacetum cinerariifolium]
MGDVNPICTLRDYSKPSYEGYMNTIEIPVRNNVVPLQSDTIRIIRTLCGYLTLWTRSFDFGGRDGHTKFKGNQRKNNRKKSAGYVNKDDQPSSSGSIYNGSEVMMVMSAEALLDWIMDSGGSYHMTPRLDLFFDFLECDGDRVLLGDNRECKIRGIGKEEPKARGLKMEYFNIFLTRSKLAYHKYLIKLDPRENSNRGITNFIGRFKGMHVSIGNFTNDTDFMIVEDIHLIIDPRLSQVVLGKPFIEISNMTHDLPEGVARFTNKTDEIAYKMPYKIEQYNSLSDLQKEHTKSVYLRNEDDKRRGVEYVMRKILGFYKECLKLRPKYVTRMDNEGEVTKFLIKNEEEIFTVPGDGVGIKT